MGTTEASGLGDLHQFIAFQHMAKKRKERQGVSDERCTDVK